MACSMQSEVAHMMKETGACLDVVGRDATDWRHLLAHCCYTCPIRRHARHPALQPREIGLAHNQMEKRNKRLQACGALYNR